MRIISLRRWTIVVAFCVLLLIPVSCGGGSGSSFVPSDNSDINQPVVDNSSDKIELSNLAITSPENGKVVGGNTMVASNSEAIRNLSKADIYIDGTLTNSGTGNFVWDSRKVKNGLHTIKLTAQSDQGSLSKEITVKVDNKTPYWTNAKTISSENDPEIWYITPTQGADDQKVTVEIHGANLTPVDFVYLSDSPNHVGSYAFDDEAVDSSLVKITIRNHQIPVWSSFDVIVSRSDGKSVSLPNAYTNLPCPTSSRIDSVAGYSNPGSNRIGLDIRGENLMAFSSPSFRVLIKDTDWLNEFGSGYDQSNPELLFWSDSRIITVPQKTGFSITFGPTYSVVVESNGSGPLGRGGPSEWRGILNVGDYVKPNVSISADIISGEAPLAVQFKGDAKSNNEAGKIVMWAWDLVNDDGGADAIDQNPKFTYTSPGTYKAKLVVFDNFGQQAVSDYIQINVGQAKSNLISPTVNPKATPDNGDNPLVVTFDAGAYSNNSGGTITNYWWDFDNNGIWDSVEKNPQHTFTASSESTSYMIKVKVVDSFSCENIGFVTVSVKAPLTYALPVANISCDKNPPLYVGSGGMQMSFDAGASYSRNTGGNIVEYKWDIENDGSIETSGWSSKIIWWFSSPEYEGDERYHYVGLTVKDSFGMESKTVFTFLLIRSALPIVSFTYDRASDVTRGTVPIKFVSQAISPVGISITHYRWDFNGDGVWEEDLSTSQVIHTFSVPLGMEWKQFKVIHQAEDNLGNTTNYSSIIQIDGPIKEAPLVTLTPLICSGSSPLDLSFNLTAASRSGGSITNITWYWNDSTIIAQGVYNLCKTFMTDGGVTQKISVKVDDSNGYTSTTSSIINLSSDGGSSGTGSAGSDLPPINIQGSTTAGSFEAQDAGIGEGAPNDTVRNAFQRAWDRSNRDAGKPTRNVYQFGNGYIQDLAEGKAGTGAIMMLNGQTEAAWIHGDIYSKYIGTGGPSNYLGYPLQDEKLGDVSSVTGAQSAYTLFSGDNVAQAMIVYHKTGAKQYGTYIVRGAIYARWIQLGSQNSQLGLPTSDQYQVGGDWRSDFENGYLIYRSNANRIDTVIYGQSNSGAGSSGSNSSVPYNVSRMFNDKFRSIDQSIIGCNTTAIIRVGDAYYQSYEGGSGWIGALVYNPILNQVFYVHGGIYDAWWNVYGACGDCRGMLGYPESDEFDFRNGRRTNFDCKYLYWASGSETAQVEIYISSNDARIYPTKYPYDSAKAKAAAALRQFRLLMSDASEFCNDHQEVIANVVTAVELGLIAISVINDVKSGGNLGGDFVRFQTVIAEGVPAEEAMIPVNRFFVKAIGSSGGDRSFFVKVAQRLQMLGKPELMDVLDAVVGGSTGQRLSQMLERNTGVANEFANWMYRNQRNSVAKNLLNEIINVATNTNRNRVNGYLDFLGDADVWEALRQNGVTTTENGMKFVFERAIQSGEVYIARFQGSAKAYFYDRATRLLFEINNRAEYQVDGKITKVIRTDNPRSMIIGSSGLIFNTPPDNGFSLGVRIQ